MARRVNFSLTIDTSRPYSGASQTSMVAVVQSVEHQIVILVVVGSSPIGHPICQATRTLF